MAEETKREETEEERRERIRRQRRRREIRRRRRRRRKILRLIRLAIIAVALILAVIGIGAVIRKYRNDKAAAAARQAQAEEDAKTLQQYPASEVLHLSFPMLMIEDEESQTDDAEDSFVDADGDGIADDVDDTGEALTADSSEEEVHALTVREFNDILQRLYDADYVLVDIYSLAETTENGFSEASVSVPIGKKPLILSEYGITYTSYDTTHADKLVFADSGSITCQYKDADGNDLTGDVDVAACVETFIGSHPDFSYENARGILSVTGAEGFMGYQIENDSSIVGSLSDEAIAALTGDGDASSGEESFEEESFEEASDESGDVEEDPESDDEQNETEEASGDADARTAVDVSQNISDAKAIVSVLKQKGWHFANGSYGNVSYASSYDLVTADMAQWQATVGSIVGETDILIFPYGADISDWSGYSSDNEKYTFLKEQGINYFCVENEEAFTWLQVEETYVRQGTHQIDSLAAFEAVTGISA